LTTARLGSAPRPFRPAFVTVVSTDPQANHQAMPIKYSTSVLDGSSGSRPFDHRDQIVVKPLHHACGHHLADPGAAVQEDQPVHLWSISTRPANPHIPSAEPPGALN